MLWVPLVAGLAIVVCIVQVQMRSMNSQWALLLSTTFMVIILIGLMPKLAEIVYFFNHLASEAGVKSMYLAPVLKTIAIAYVASFGAQICRDAGEQTIASVVELAGKIVIMLVALPVLQAILYSVLGILG